MGNTAPIMVAKGKIDYGLTNDYMFRAILQKSRKTLIGLASALLHLNPEDIKDIEITNPIILGESINAKTFILDVNILLNNSRMLNLEMQVNNLHNWKTGHYVIYVQTSASLIKVTHTKILNLLSILVFLIILYLKTHRNSTLNLNYRIRKLTEGIVTNLVSVC